MAAKRGGGTRRPENALPPARGRRSDPEPVRELLPKVMTEMGLDAASESARLMRCWDAALGADLAPHCRPQGIHRGVAHATVEDSAWMQRIQLQKPVILARLREALGRDGDLPHELLDLRLRIGPAARG